jgi:hypothetical protein
MALLYAECVGKYANGTTGWADLTNDNVNYYPNFTTTSTIDLGGGRFSDTGAWVNGVTSRYMSVDTSGMSGSTLIIGMCFKRKYEQPTTTRELISCFSTVTGSLPNWKLWYGANGQIYCTNALNQLSGSAPYWATIGYDVWHTIEIKVTHNNTTGTIDVLLDGVNIISETGLDTLYSTIGPPDGVRFLSTIISCELEWFYICDGSGSAPFNDFLGDFRWEQEVVTGDGATANWTPLSGANYTNLDEALGSYDDDTTYISSATTDQDNYVTMNGLTLTGMNSVLFVKHNALARTDGSDSIAMLTLSSATTDQDADYALSTSYEWVVQYEEVDPNTASAWANASAINSAEWGVRFRP